MVFQIQKISNYGTSTPAVARTLLQGSEILGFFAATEAQREEAKATLHELQRHLIRCIEVRDQIKAEVSSAYGEIKNKGFDFQSSGRVVTLPSVVDLQSRAESCLQSAKLAIRETAHLVQPFYGAKLDHKFHKFAAWAERQFGQNDMMTQAVRSWEPWVKRIVDMRNAVDHPSDEPGGKKLNTQNFSLTGTRDAPDLGEPTWGLVGEPESPLLSDMTTIIERIIELGEDILAGLFYKLKHNFPLVIYEIPVEQRNPSCPIRLRVALPTATPCPDVP